jgi:hypothetical protein
MRRSLAALAILWASPWTMFGLLIGGLGLLAGGGVQRTGRVVEFWGGGAAWFLRMFPLIAGAAAITFGHTVLARSKVDLDDSRSHELIHVQQYERWGPLFIPAYLSCYVALWLIGRHPYFDNPFEREAFENG